MSRCSANSITPSAGKTKLELWADADQHGTVSGAVNGLHWVACQSGCNCVSFAKRCRAAMPYLYLRFVGLQLEVALVDLWTAIGGSGDPWHEGHHRFAPTVAAGTAAGTEACSSKNTLLTPVNQIHCVGPWNNTMLTMWDGTQLEVAPRCVIVSDHLCISFYVAAARSVAVIVNLYLLPPTKFRT
jgi:hypothetical protein